MAVPHDKPKNSTTKRPRVMMMRYAVTIEITPSMLSANLDRRKPDTEKRIPSNKSQATPQIASQENSIRTSSQ